MNITELPDGIIISIRVQPRSSRNRIMRDSTGSIKVYLNAPPVDGAANHACLALLSDVLHIPKSNLILVSGQKSRTKTIKILGVSVEKFAEALQVNEDKN